MGTAIKPQGITSILYYCTYIPLFIPSTNIFNNIFLRIYPGYTIHCIIHVLLLLSRIHISFSLSLRTSIIGCRLCDMPGVYRVFSSWNTNLLSSRSYKNIWKYVESIAIGYRKERRRENKLEKCCRTVVVSCSGCCTADRLFDMSNARLPLAV